MNLDTAQLASLSARPVLAIVNDSDAFETSRGFIMRSSGNWSSVEYIGKIANSGLSFWLTPDNDIVEEKDIKESKDNYTHLTSSLHRFVIVNSQTVKDLLYWDIAQLPSSEFNKAEEALGELSKSDNIPDKRIKECFSKVFSGSYPKGINFEQ